MINELLGGLGVDLSRHAGTELAVFSPRDGALMARLRSHAGDEVETRIASAHQAYLAWRLVPAPQRGELVRLLGEVVRENKAALGRLVTLECGKIG